MNWKTWKLLRIPSALSWHSKLIQTFIEAERSKTMLQTIFVPQTQPLEYREQIIVPGPQLAARVKELIDDGNVRRLIIKQEGHILVEIPVTWGVMGTILSPTLAAVEAVGRTVTDCTLEVVRTCDCEPPQD